MQGTAQRCALPALGRAAECRPIGKMLRRRKRLGIAPDSPASGARFVSPLYGLGGTMPGLPFSIALQLNSTSAPSVIIRSAA